MVNFLLGWLCGWAVIAIAMLSVWYAAKSEYNAGKAIEKKREMTQLKNTDFDKLQYFP